MHVVILGAGIAGLACADALRAGGHSTTLFDKGRGPGGRMSTRRVEIGPETFQFDHGAQYFTVRNTAFKQLVAAWAQAGVAAPWAPAGGDAWVGVPGMNTPLRHMAEHHDVHFNHHVAALSRDASGWRAHVNGVAHGPFDAAVIALPAEQAAGFLGMHDLRMASQAMAARSQPCWTAMILFDGRLDIEADCLRQQGIIGWAARNSAKPGRARNEAWVVQAHGSWSADHLEDPAGAVADALVDALLEQGGPRAPSVRYRSAHRWRFAMTPGVGREALWNPALRLGACGDWLSGPRVELAWLSGRSLGDIMSEHNASRHASPIMHAQG